MSSCVICIWLQITLSLYGKSNHTWNLDYDGIRQKVVHAPLQPVSSDLLIITGYLSLISMRVKAIGYVRVMGVCHGLCCCLCHEALISVWSQSVVYVNNDIMTN